MRVWQRRYVNVTCTSQFSYVMSLECFVVEPRTMDILRASSPGGHNCVVVG